MTKPIDQSRDYVASLTGLRGIAALSVFMFHYSYLNPGIRMDLAIPVIGQVLQFPLGFGFTGVDMFFVLSGFLLSLPFARATLNNTARPPTSPYYKRRLLRVFPAYYAQLAIILIVGAWFVSWKQINGVSLLAHLTMFFNIGSNPIRPMVGVWWTLPVELSFYLILPLIASFLRPTRLFVLLVLSIALSVLTRQWAADHFSESPVALIGLAASQLPGSLPEFLLGATAAVVVHWFKFNDVKRPSPLILDGMLLLGATLAVLWLWFVLLPHASASAYWTGRWSMLTAPVALGVPFSLMVISLYWGSPLGRMLFANRVIYFLGLISYSLYLWHFVVMQQAAVIFGDSWAGLHELVRFAFSLILVVLFSTLSYYLFERPFSRPVIKKGQ